MKGKRTILVYGSYGYTGRLIVRELRRLNLPAMLSGRNEEKLKAQSSETGYPYQALAIEDHKGLCDLLSETKVVIHCAGPFIHTAESMVRACLETGTHYTDITGEFTVFEMLQRHDETAKEKNITILPGTGFDVVPSDCLASYLHARLPDATHLDLAFMNSRGGLSRGTAFTAIENLGEGSFVRRDGKLKRIPSGSLTRSIDFGERTMSATSIPWGDISSAYFSTRIPNITVYMGAPRKVIRMMKWSEWINPLLRLKWTKDFMRGRLSGKPDGPSEEKRDKNRCFFRGTVQNRKGEQFSALLQTPDGYALTAFTSVHIAHKIISDNFKIGFQTPSTAYGADLILEAPASFRADV